MMKFNSKYFLEYLFCSLITFKAVWDTESLNCIKSLTLHQNCLKRNSTLCFTYFMDKMNTECILIPVCCRLGEFCGFIETIEDLQKQLQREDLTSEQYKDLQAQFQVQI